jgi:hypothetical protein
LCLKCGTIVRCGYRLGGFRTRGVSR